MVRLTQQQEEDLEMLREDFSHVPPDDIKGLLQVAFSADEIRAILKACFTHAQIRAIITRIKVAQQDAHGTDKLGLMTVQICDLVNRVAAAINSPSEEIQLEGEVARPLISDLVSFQHKSIDPITCFVIGEVDVETLKAIIEVTTEKNGKTEQALKEQHDKLINPNGKQVILFASNYSRAADQQFATYGIPIIRSFKDLFDYLRRL